MIQYGTSQSPRNQGDAPNNDEAQRLKIQARNQPPAAKLKVPQKDLLVFFRQLSVILESGVALEEIFDGGKVDLLVRFPQDAEQPIHRIAKRQGVRLL